MSEKKELDLSLEGKVRKLLGFMKNPYQCMYYKAFLKSLEESLGNGVELSQFGINDQELDKIIRYAALVSAKLNIESLRKGTAKNTASTIKDFEQDMEYGNLNYDQVGTTQEEISSYSQKINAVT